MHKRFLTYDKHNPPAGVNAAGMQQAADLVINFNDFPNYMWSANPDKSKLEYDEGKVLSCIKKLKAGKAVSVLVLACGVYGGVEYNGVFRANAVFNEPDIPLRCFFYQSNMYINLSFNADGSVREFNRELT